MKTFTRVIAVLMMVAILATLLAACKKEDEKGYMDTHILGSWKQTDEVDGNWTWTFNDDNTCRLVSETNGFDSEGTFRIENETNGKIHITLTEWGEEKLFTYACTEKVLDLEEMDHSFHCFKQ